MTQNQTLVTMKHIRQADLCAKGARAWFLSHGFSWNDFLENGKDADELDATGDALAHQVTAIARQENSNGQ